MHRIPLAVALIGAVAAAGCGRSKPTSASASKGAAGSTYTVTINSPGALGLIESGTVGADQTSFGIADAKIKCGAGFTACSADYAWDTVLALRETPQTVNGALQYFNGWAGDCFGTGVCVLSGNAEKYVVASFSATPQSHPNWTGDRTLHPSAFSSDTLRCKDCHGDAYQGAGIAPACDVCHDGTAAIDFRTTHVSGAACGDCHAAKASQWASPADLHAASAADVLTNVVHDTNELLVDECLQCHSMFQRPLGIATFVTPIDQVGSPAGTWTLLPGAAEWQATRCEVCHDPTSTEVGKLAKYGAILDQAFDPSYTAASALPPPHQWVFDGTSAYVNTPIAPTSNDSLGIAATKICSSCHDPDDQGGDPNKTIGAVDYGPQGGDSRAFVTSSHAGMACVDCHPTHDFTQVDPSATTCSTSGCHGGTLPAGPGVVHVNHLP